MIFSHAIQLLQCVLFLLGAICVIPASASQVDKLLAKDNAAKGVEGLITGQALSDLAFLRNASIDLVGRIPTYAEIREYQEWPLAKRRSRLVDRLLKDEGFADRWTVFFADMLRIRSRADGFKRLLSSVLQSIEDGTPLALMAQ